MKNNLYVGQIVFIKTKENDFLKEVKISYIGNKWFTLTDSWYGRFNKENLLHDGGFYSPKYRIYLDKKEYEEECEFNDLYSKINNTFGVYNSIKLPLDKLRKIWNIIQS